jgi:hypothetical protein
VRRRVEKEATEKEATREGARSRRIAEQHRKLAEQRAEKREKKRRGHVDEIEGAPPEKVELVVPEGPEGRALLQALVRMQAELIAENPTAPYLPIRDPAAGRPRRTKMYKPQDEERFWIQHSLGQTAYAVNEFKFCWVSPLPTVLYPGAIYQIYTLDGDKPRWGFASFLRTEDVLDPISFGSRPWLRFFPIPLATEGEGIGVAPAHGRRTHFGMVQRVRSRKCGKK